MPCADTPDPMRRSHLYTCDRIRLTPHRTLSCELRLQRLATSRASSIKSETRKRERSSPMTISGSGATRSVHCGGTEQTVSASTCSKSRLPYRLYRSPTQVSCRPLSGWNGCVTRTRRFEVTGASAFRIELQTSRARPVRRVVARRRRRRPADRERVGAVHRRLHAGRTPRAVADADYARRSCFGSQNMI